MVVSNRDQFPTDNWFNPVKFIEDGLNWFDNSITYWSNVINNIIVENRHTLLPLYTNGIDILAQYLKNQSEAWKNTQDERDRMKQRYLDIMKINYDLALMRINKSK